MNISSVSCSHVNNTHIAHYLYKHAACGHCCCVSPAGGLISAIFDETFGVLLYAAGRWGHADCTMVFTARLEVDYKKVRPVLTPLAVVVGV